MSRGKNPNRYGNGIKGYRPNKPTPSKTETGRRVEINFNRTMPIPEEAWPFRQREFNMMPINEGPIGEADFASLDEHISADVEIQFEEIARDMAQREAIRRIMDDFHRAYPQIGGMFAQGGYASASAPVPALLHRSEAHLTTAQSNMLRQLTAAPQSPQQITGMDVHIDPSRGRDELVIISGGNRIGRSRVAQNHFVQATAAEMVRHGRLTGAEAIRRELEGQQLLETGESMTITGTFTTDDIDMDAWRAIFGAAVQSDPPTTPARASDALAAIAEASARLTTQLGGTSAQFEEIARVINDVFGPISHVNAGKDELVLKPPHKDAGKEIPPTRMRRSSLGVDVTRVRGKTGAVEIHAKSEVPKHEFKRRNRK